MKPLKYSRKVICKKWILKIVKKTMNMGFGKGDHTWGNICIGCLNYSKNRVRNRAVNNNKFLKIEKNIFFH